MFTTMLTDEFLISQFSLMSIHIIQEEALAKAAAAKAKAKAKAAEAKAKAKAKAEAAEAKAKADAVGKPMGYFYWWGSMGKPMGKLFGIFFGDISIGILFIQWENQWVSMNLRNVALTTRPMPQLQAVFGRRRRLLTKWCVYESPKKHLIYPLVNIQKAIENGHL